MSADVDIPVPISAVKKRVPQAFKAPTKPPQLSALTAPPATQKTGKQYQEVDSDVEQAADGEDMDEGMF